MQMLNTQRSLAFLLLFAVAAGAAPSPGEPSSITSIFAPETTPARSILELSVFVLGVTGAIFVVVGGLLVYSIVKFRAKPADPASEPAQVYGSTQIELAWTIIPVLIVVVLFLTTARVIHAVQDAPKPPTAFEVTVIGGEVVYQAPPHTP